MSDNVDNFLAHYGVPGMKWGKRKAAQIQKSAKNRTKGLREDVKNNPREAKTMARVKDFNQRGKANLAKSKGSKTHANSKVVGRTFALGVLTNVAGSVAMNTLGSNPTARASIALGTTALNTVNLAVGARDIIGISIQPGKK